jgi:hypothetical protein
MRQNDAATNGNIKQNMPHQQFQQSFIKAELANAAKAAGTKAKKRREPKTSARAWFGLRRCQDTRNL